MWDCKKCLVVKAFWHSLQVNDIWLFSLFFKWFQRFPFSLQEYAHCVQLYSFTVLCEALWHFKVANDLKSLAHIWQTYRFSSLLLWNCLCLFSSFMALNAMVHRLHVKGLRLVCCILCVLRFEIFTFWTFMWSFIIVTKDMFVEITNTCECLFTVWTSNWGFPLNWKYSLMWFASCFCFERLNDFSLIVQFLCQKEQLNVTFDCSEGETFFYWPRRNWSVSWYFGWFFLLLRLRFHFHETIKYDLVSTMRPNWDG